MIDTTEQGGLLRRNVGWRDGSAGEVHDSTLIVIGEDIPPVAPPVIPPDEPDLPCDYWVDINGVPYVQYSVTGLDVFVPACAGTLTVEVIDGIITTDPDIPGTIIIGTVPDGTYTIVPPTAPTVPPTNIWIDYPPLNSVSAGYISIWNVRPYSLWGQWSDPTSYAWIKSFNDWQSAAVLTWFEDSYYFPFLVSAIPNYTSNNTSSYVLQSDGHTVLEQTVGAGATKKLYKIQTNTATRTGDAADTGIMAFVSFAITGATETQLNKFMTDQAAFEPRMLSYTGLPLLQESDWLTHPNNGFERVYYYMDDDYTQPNRTSAVGIVRYYDFSSTADAQAFLTEVLGGA